MARSFFVVALLGLMVSNHLGAQSIQKSEVSNSKPPIYKPFSIVDENRTEKFVVDINQVGDYDIDLIFRYDSGVDMTQLREFTGDGSYTYYTTGPGEPRQLRSPQDGTSADIASKARKGEYKIVYVRQGVIVPLYVKIVKEDNKQTIFSSHVDTGGIYAGGSIGIRRKIHSLKLNPGSYSVEITNIAINRLPGSVRTVIGFLPPRQY